VQETQTQADMRGASASLGSVQIPTDSINTAELMMAAAGNINT
jgi:hypothetical protein